MIQRQAIQTIVDRIVDTFAPMKVILFGSYANGSPTADSDIDLLVVMPFEGSALRMAAKISRNLPHRFPIDVIVRTPNFVSERLKQDDVFLRDILESGRTLYDATDAGMD